MSVYMEEGCAYSPAEDEPISPHDMTYLSTTQRISVLSVNTRAKGMGNRIGGGKHEKENMEIL